MPSQTEEEEQVVEGGDGETADDEVGKEALPQAQETRVHVESEEAMKEKEEKEELLEPQMPPEPSSEVDSAHIPKPTHLPPPTTTTTPSSGTKVAEVAPDGPQDKKAREFIEQAERKMRSAESFFGGLFG